RYLGASVAHIGIAVLFIGIIASTRYDRSVTLSLPLNDPSKAFGYKLTYVGTSEVDGGKTAYDVVVGDGSSTFLAPLIMYASAYEGGAIIRNPYIFSLVNYDAFTHPALLAFIGRNMVTRDLYLSPQSVENGLGTDPGMQTSGHGIPIPLTMNEPISVGSYTFTFEGFKVPKDQKVAMMSGQAFNLTSIVTLASKDGRTQTIHLTNEINPGGRNEMATMRLESGAQFKVIQIHVNDKTKQSGILLSYLPAGNSADAALLSNGSNGQTSSQQVLILVATIKPFINLVWGGVIIMVIGFIITWRRRREDLVGLPR
ncbi:MAG: hypothetical protein B7Z63_05175, partial [Ignavibacteriae bacterium 37-53-5]